MSLTVGSLFSGIGGLDLGLERAGGHVVWQCEIDEKCRELLNLRWPDVPVYDDVTTMRGGEVEPVDVLCGGFPCQDLSVAGNRAGLAGERSGLFHQFMRLAGEIAPRWVVIENVPGLLSSNDGRDMGVVLGVLADLGYGWCYRVLDAQYFGVAQRRRRVFIVGRLGDTASAAAVLLEPESCDRDSPPSRATGPSVAALTANGVGTCGADDNQGQAGHLIPALTTRCGDTMDDQQPGQLVPTWTGAAQHDQFVALNDVAPTLAHSSNHHGGHHQPMVALPLAFAWQAGGDKTSSGAFEDDMSPTLPKTQTIAVAYPLAMRGRDDGAELEMGEEGVYNALRAGDGGSSRQALVAYSTKLHNTHSNQSGKFYEEYTPSLQADSPLPAVANGMAVRRLTPLECERLQGFPDGWTEGFADSARYRMLGNAVAVPHATWIGHRLVEVDRASRPTALSGVESP